MNITFAINHGDPAIDERLEVLESSGQSLTLVDKIPTPDSVALVVISIKVR